MVFSKELICKNQFGQAIAVPCQRLVNNSEDLIKEAKYLWATESNEKYFTDIPTCKGWGRIVLLENTNRPIPGEIRRGWCEHVSRNTRYRKKLKHTASEESVVDESGGFLDIDWPESVDGSALETDVLLATATKPTIDDDSSYPSVQIIAEAWNSRKGKNYID